MSGTFPSSQGLRGLNFTNSQPNLLSVSVSGRRQAKTQGAQAFSFTAQTPPMTTAEYKEIMGFLAAQQGQYSSFQIVLPNISTPAGSVTGNVLDVNEPSNAAAGAKSIAVDGGTAGQTGYLKKGDVVRFTAKTGSTQVGSKVYILTADLDTDGGGAGTLSIEPGLIEEIANDTEIQTNDVEFTVFMTSAVQEYQTGLSDHTQLEFEAREAF